MSDKYILGIDQSTQGTKALLFDEQGKILGRCDLPHEQIINELGWVEHDPVQIYRNTIAVVKALLEKTAIDKRKIIGVGLTNQRETAVVWDRETRLPVYNAIVWQCARGASICKQLEAHGKEIHNITGLHLSPYFSAAKIAWILQNVEGTQEKAEAGLLACGTMDSWLIYQLTNKKSLKTDYSNASRTQLFDIHQLRWNEKLCDWFGINPSCLPEVCDSNAYYGDTDFEGLLEQPVPIHGVLGDSHGALFGQQCHQKGMIKATYGTGSSIMMNIGDNPVISEKGIVTSLAWGLDGKVTYVLEGNINYSGAVISWLKDDLKLLTHSSEAEALAFSANPSDKTYLIPAFSGLGAPYWKSDAMGMIYGMTRTTGKAELVKAALDSIAYQISDIIHAMEQETAINVKELRVDGGPTRNRYLMQFQSDILNTAIQVPEAEELSVIGVSYLAGISMGIYKADQVFADRTAQNFIPKLNPEERLSKSRGWDEAVHMVLKINK